MSLEFSKVSSPKAKLKQKQVAIAAPGADREKPAEKKGDRRWEKNIYIYIYICYIHIHIICIYIYTYIHI